jgi:hypothetical protein
MTPVDCFEYEPPGLLRRDAGHLDQLDALGRDVQIRMGRGAAGWDPIAAITNVPIWSRTLR